MFETSGEVEQFSRSPNLLLHSISENEEEGRGHTNADIHKRYKEFAFVNRART